MPLKKSTEVGSSVDVVTNILNVVLIIIGATLVSLGIFYMYNGDYDYLMRLGTIIVSAGAVAMLIGLWGFITHGRIVKRMKAQAKADLNY